MLVWYVCNQGAFIFLHSENGQGPRPIHWAARNGHVAVVDILLRYQKNEAQLKLTLLLII